LCFQSTGCLGDRIKISISLFSQSHFCTITRQSTLLWCNVQNHYFRQYFLRNPPPFALFVIRGRFLARDFIYLYFFFNILSATPDLCNQFWSIHPCTYKHALSSAHFFHRARVYFLFCFPTVLIWSSSVIFQQFQKVVNRIGWLDGLHCLSPILYDKVPLFVYTDQLSSHCAFICSVYWRLVYLLCSGFLYYFCLLSESYETINYYITIGWSRNGKFCPTPKVWLNHFYMAFSS